MKVKGANVDVSEDEQICLKITLGNYLRQFERSLVEEAAPNSNIGTAVRLYNRVDNLRLGNHEMYRVDRLPLLNYAEVTA